MVILLVFLLKKELGLENWIPNVTISFDFYLTLGRMMAYILPVLWCRIFRTILWGIGVLEQRLSYEKSLRWHSAKARTCLPLEWSLEARVLGFFRFLGSWFFCSLNYTCHPDILIWISVPLNVRLQETFIVFCTVGSSQCSSTVHKSLCFWLHQM